MKKEKGKIVITGSIAYDRIMDFPDVFKNHILPDKIHMLNVSFVINDLKESFGGTAGNIAYSLALLDERPILLGVVGKDFVTYEDWLKKQNIDISMIRKVDYTTTSCAYITTDKDDNQITAFYPGPADADYVEVINDINNIEIAIVSPDSKDRMIGFMKIFQKLNVPYIFDPGQQITTFSNEELRFAIQGSKILIGNDYEIELIQKIMNIKKGDLEKMVDVLIVTKGGNGSVVVKDGEVLKIKPINTENVVDPTGAGDAYRSGLLKGLIEGWDYKKIGKLASMVSVKAVEKQGTQNHKFNYNEIKHQL
ncbi:carbohydrate kinase family protein [Candidatus Parcubacteria bacterium]|nr:carbohydrate kinase family protein [Candidatus Parcubacteria bacterium]